MPLGNVGVDLTPVTFRVDAPVRHGETLCIVGDVPGLGSGNYKYGVQLVTTPNSFPTWFTQHPIPLVAGKQVNYKYAIFSGGNFARWEDRNDGARTVFVENQAGQVVHDKIKIDETFTTSPEAKQTPSLHRSRSSGGTDERSTSFRERRKKGRLLDHDDGVIIVCYYLPVKIRKVTSTESSSESDSETREAELANMATPSKGKDVTVGQGSSSSPRTRKGSLVASGLRRWSSASSAEKASVWSIEWDESALLSRKKSSIADHMRVLYIGYPNCGYSELTPHEQDSLATALLRFRCVPVFLKPDVRDLHYHVYCYDTLRKLFHHQVDVYGALPTRWWNGPMHEASWIAYRSVNQSFGEKVVECYNEGDIIWIHGYELLLLPSFLKRRLQAANPHIGLFIHSPFPSSEIFRTLSVRDDILRSMLCSDQIGFHLYEYARPFLSCCHRILGIQHHGQENDPRGLLTLDYQGRRVYITVCHAGIEPELVLTKLQTPRVYAKAQAILQAAVIPNQVKEEAPASLDGGSTSANDYSRVQDQIIIIGLDSIDPLAGVQFKLLAYEGFLEKNPQLADRLCMLQVCLKVQRDSEESKDARKIIRGISRRINATYPRAPGRRPAVCLFEWSTCSFSDRLALFSIADIFLDTPLRTGLDLKALEFTVVADARKSIRGPWSAVMTPDLDPMVASLRRNPTLILSEFTAAFRILPASLRCNPWREAEVIETLELALTMPEEERIVRSMAALKFVNTHVESGWAKLVLSDIKGSSRPNQETLKKEGLTTAGIGFGLQFRAIEFRPNFKHLLDEAILEAYRTSFRRLIILDYGGTTVHDDYVPHDAFTQNKHHKFEFRFRPQGEAILPRPQMIQTLQTLVSDPANFVFIVSGRERQELEAAFADVPGIGLTAEHGCFYSWGDRTMHQVASLKHHGSEARNLVSSNSFSNSSISPNTTRDDPDEQGLNKNSSRTKTPPLVAAPTSSNPNTLRSRSSSLGSHEHMTYRRSQSMGNIAVDSGESRKFLERLQRYWVTLSDHFDDSWMDLSEQIMDVYTQRTNGTYIERKGSSIVWQFRDAEPEFGALQAAELQDHLHGVLKAFPIEVVSGKGYVEVCPQGVDKGNACAHILGMLWPNESLPDFVLCLGDDTADEAMFEFFLQLYGDEHDDETKEPLSKGPMQLASSILSRESSTLSSLDAESFRTEVEKDTLEASRLFTCVVGEKPSVAQYFVNDVDEVGDLLGALAKVSTKTHLTQSTSDIRRLEADLRVVSGELGNGYPVSKSLRHKVSTIEEDVPADELSKSNSVPNLSYEIPKKAAMESRRYDDDDDDDYNNKTNPSLDINSRNISRQSDMDTSSTTSSPSGQQYQREVFERRKLSKQHQSVLDLRLAGVQNKKEMIASASMPALSEYFGLVDVSQPTSTTAHEYLDLIADDDDDGNFF